jgi:hypothetical protein
MRRASFLLLVVALCVCGCSARWSLNPLEREITNRLAATQCVLGSTFAQWTNALGSPLVVDQSDGGHTFFYWPDSGIGVFCHPHYRGQYQRERQRDWVVTSIFVPLQTTVQPKIPPVEPDTRIAFKKLLFRREEVVQKRWMKLPKVRVFQEGGVLESLEIEKPDSLLGDYD